MSHGALPAAGVQRRGTPSGTRLCAARRRNRAPAVLSSAASSDPNAGLPDWTRTPLRVRPFARRSPGRSVHPDDRHRMTAGPRSLGRGDRASGQATSQRQPADTPLDGLPGTASGAQTARTAGVRVGRCFTWNDARGQASTVLRPRRPASRGSSPRTGTRLQARAARQEADPGGGGTPGLSSRGVRSNR